MPAIETVLAAMLSLPGYSLDDQATRAERYRPVAEAISAVSQSPETAAALVALGWHESGFAQAVLEGHCERMPSHSRCDQGRARGVWQAWRVACPAAYAYEAGTPESLLAEAKCAANNLYSARNRCITRADDAWSGMFSGYRGASCTWAPAARRVQTFRVVLAMIRRLG
jgi:hypothetical protein